MATTTISQRFTELAEQAFQHWYNRTDVVFDDALFTTLKEQAELLAAGGNLSAALRLLERALWVAEQKGEPLHGALIWRARANVLQHHEQFEASLAAVNQAVALYQRYGTALDVAKARTVEVALLATMGRFAEAEALGRWIQAQFEASAFPLGLARVTHGLAHVYHSGWQLEAAQHEYEKAQTLFAQLNLPADLAWVQHNMGNLAFDRDQPAAAISKYIEAQPLFAEMGDLVLLVKTEFNLARCYVRLTRYEAALAHLANARKLLEQLTNSPDHGYVDLHEAQVRRYLNQPDQAEKLLHQALAHFRHHDYHVEAAEALFELGYLLAGEEDPTRLAGAVEYLMQAEASLQGYAMPLFLAWVHLEQAELLLRLTRLPAAQSRAQQSLMQFQAAGLPLRAAQAQIVLARCKERLQPAEAERHYKTVLTQLRPKPTLLAAQCWQGIGRLALARGALAAAEQAYTKAFETLDLLRRMLHSHEHQAGFFEERQELIEELLQAIYRQPHSQARLVNWLERITANALADLLATVTSALSVDEALQRLLAERAQVAKQLDQRMMAGKAEGAQLAIAGQPTRMRQVTQEHHESLATLSRTLQLLDEEITRRQGAGSGWRTGRAATVTSVQAILDEQTLLIYYCTIQGQLHAVTLTGQQDDIQVYRLSTTLPEVTTQWLQAHRAIFRSQHADTRAQSRLAGLFALLFAPLRERLSAKSNVLIVPSRALACIPYAALYDRDTQQFLGETHSIQFIPSATVLQHCAAQPPATKAPLLVGYPGVKGEPDYLEHVHHEIHALTGLLPASRILLGDQATIERVFQLMQGSCVVHLAGHVLSQPKDPLRSGMPLAEARWLRAADLYLQAGKLCGSLVVLSGCNTGKGVATGSDLLGFTSAFLYAGASAVLAGLWRIDDQATATFMEHFYRALNTAQLDSVQALQAAQRAMLASDVYCAPYFWAPFVLTGAARSPFPAL